ncbi:MAG: alcohol dehydrogenase catalytic domain-containing protein [Candidatus Schekmanbacteria bacterium]|nr:alcohol dehydrogenase catalytic domain-containing protein [Candidatus Schekmanbacteria bacterium]
MRVAKYYNNRDVRLEEMPVPKIGAGEILVKIIASGVCGSDVMEWYRIKKAPLVLGHEITGDIVETGEGVEKFKKGDRVTVAHHVPCNTCYYCLNGEYSVCDTLRSTNFDPGGFAEYVRVPKINVDRGVFLLPDEVSYEDGTFSEPLGCVMRGQKVADVRPAQTVLVIGSGISGLLHIKLARAVGAAKIFATDISEYRLSAAKRFGADEVIRASDDVSGKIKSLNGGRLADRVILCAGADSAIEQALQCIDRGGTILLFALPEPGKKFPIDLWNMWRDNVTITTAYASPPADTIPAIELIRSKRVDVSDMITHRLPLSEAGLGFKLVYEAKDSIKVIIEPQR